MSKYQNIYDHIESKKFSVKRKIKRNKEEYRLMIERGLVSYSIKAYSEEQLLEFIDGCYLNYKEQHK